MMKNRLSRKLIDLKWTFSFLVHEQASLVRLVFKMILRTFVGKYLHFCDLTGL